ncbi:MAG: nuclear transport factor 2 family protein [Acidobacteriota bacterium]
MTLNPDVQSLDAIMSALYECISGPAGERDWDRLNELFARDAKLIPLLPDDHGGLRPQYLSPQLFASQTAPYFREHDFYEVETSRDHQRFESLIQVFSRYEARHEPEGPAFATGVNSVQVLDDGSRYWILNVAWPRRPEVLEAGLHRVEG